MTEFKVRYTIRREEKEIKSGGVYAGTVDGLVHVLSRRPCRRQEPPPSAMEGIVADDPPGSSLTEEAPRMAEFEIRYTIFRDDEEIGFGSAGAGTVDDAAAAMETAIQRRQWEASVGMPDPASVDKEEASAR